MGDVVRRMSWSGANPAEAELLLRREWLVTNGLGGYASGTIAGVPTRRYHGLLIAALPAPLGRMVMLRHLREQLHFPDGTVVQIGGEEHAENDLEMPTVNSLTEFRLENGLPVWRYQVAETIIETRLLLPYMQNTVHITYRVVSGAGPVRLELRPSMHFRGHEAHVNTPFQGPYTLTIRGERYEICAAPDAADLAYALLWHAGWDTVDPHCRRWDGAYDLLSRRSEAGLRLPGCPVESRLFQRRPAPWSRRHPGGLNGDLGDAPGAGHRCKP